MNSPFNFFQSNLFSELQNTTLTSSVDPKSEVNLRSRDIHFLLNEKALEALDPSALKKYLEPLKIESGPNDTESFKMTDADLFNFCQSRFIQQPSDVQKYAKILQDGYEQISKNIENERKYKQDYNAFVDSLRDFSKSSFTMSLPSSFCLSSFLS